MKNPDSALQEALGVVSQFSGVAGTLSFNESIKSACAASPLTKGRTFRDIVLDDVLNVFEFMMTNVPRKEQPIEFYRVIMQMRSGRPTTLTQADSQLRHRMAVHSVAPPTHIPDMFKITAGKVNEALLKSLEEQWDDIKHGIVVSVFNEGAFRVAQNSDIAEEKLQLFIDNVLAKSAKETNMTDTNIPIAYLASGARQVNWEDAPLDATMSTQLQFLLSKRCENITDQASKKPPVYGREPEIDRLKQILLHSQKPFALLHGQEGVGQGAVVNALSRYLQSDDAPKRLKGGTIHRFNLEEFLFYPKDDTNKSAVDTIKSLIHETESHNKSGKPPVVLYLDDIGLHAGDSKHSQNDNFLALRNALERQLRSHNNIPLICSVTDEELFALDSVDKDLMKHFQRVDVTPLSAENTLKEVRHIADELESVHHLKVPDDVLEHVVHKTGDKMPNHPQSGKSLQILRMAAANAEAEGANEVSDLHVDQAVSYKTKLPLDVVRSELSDRIQNLESNMLRYVHGQDEAVKTICSEVRLVANNLHDPNKPLGVFYMNGATGSGKTHICKMLNRLLFGNEDLIRVDLSSYSSEHTVSGIIGAPPGYVGYGKRGPLDDVEDKPFSVVLLDEEDKAHPDVKSALLRALDEGTLVKLDGKVLDFRNTIVVLTSNMGATAAQQAFTGASYGFIEKTNADREADAEKARNSEVKMRISPEFYNRVTPVRIKLLDRPATEKVALDAITLVSKALAEQKKYKDMILTVAPNVIQELADIGFDPLNGARPMGRAVKQSLKIPLNEWLNNDANKGLLGQTFELVVKGIKNGFDVEVKKPQLPLLSLPAPAPVVG